MSHHIYHTEGFILDGLNFAESNKYFYLFTKELGLVGATAQGVRDLKSKLRFSLQHFSHATLSLVRGKAGWKVVSAVLICDFDRLFKDEHEKFLLSARVMSLVKRLVHGEEKNEHLFAILSSGFSFLQTLPKDQATLLDFESILVLRILHNLGYVGTSTTLNHIVSDTVWHENLLLGMSPLRHEAIRTINDSLHESQL